MFKALGLALLLGSAAVVDTAPEQVDVTTWSRCTVNQIEIVCSGTRERN